MQQTRRRVGSFPDTLPGFHAFYATFPRISSCSPLQAQIPPIRMLLTGPNGASSAASSRGSAGPVLRHDFRRSCLAVVPLRLAVRNNTAMEARLQMEVWGGTGVEPLWRGESDCWGKRRWSAPCWSMAEGPGQGFRVAAC